MFSQDEFKKYATKHKGISSLNLHRFESAVSSYINPTIIEERQLNVASMDVFSRLMMDRIIFLGVPINYSSWNRQTRPRTSRFISTRRAVPFMPD